LSNRAYWLYFLMKNDMKFFWKCIGIFMVFSIVLFGFSTQAATGDSIETGNTLPYTWSLATYLNAQESEVSAVLSTVYTQLYTTFSKTWLNILKSIEYQSLVCLWAMKEVSLLSQLQKDRMQLNIAFKQDFIGLENQILALEEKQALQVSDNINVFDVGTTYESEKTKLKALIDEKVRLHKWFINNFATSYATKNNEFLTTFLQYSTANKDLIKGIQDKMTKVQGVVNAFSWLESTIAAIHAKATGLDDLIKKMDESRLWGITNLDNTLQSIADINIKKYKKIQNILTGLTQQKEYILRQYQTDFDEYFNNNFKNRYNRAQYLVLKNEIDTFQSKFYISTNKLNCSNILSASEDAATLLTKINAMKIVVNSWLAKIETEGISNTFKDQLFSGFQSLYIQKFRQRYAEYIKYTKDYIAAALKNMVKSTVSTILPPVVPSASEKISYVFTKPFRSGEYAEGIKVLQNLLTTLQLYSWAIDGVYNPATKNAVYMFQLSKWLLKGYENKPDVWWWMGPATRNALNNLTK